MHLLGPTTDGLGRTVASDDHIGHIRSMLIFNPRTWALLGEVQTVLAGNSYGYSPGTRIGWSSCLRRAVVDSTQQRPPTREPRRPATPER